MLKSVKGIVVELVPKQLCYNGVQLEYDFINKTANTQSFSNISITSDYNSPIYAPDRGIVVDSDDSKIQVGDEVILEYFSVIRRLGRSIEQFQQAPDETYEEVDGKIRIPVRTRQTPEQYVYAIFRKGEFVPYNNFNIVELIEETESEKLHILTLDKKTEKYMEKKDTKKCRVLYGIEKGKVCIYNPDFLLGQAQQSIIDGKLVHFIQSEYILASLN